MAGRSAAGQARLRRRRAARGPVPAAGFLAKAEEPRSRQKCLHPWCCLRSILNQPCYYRYYYYCHDCSHYYYYYYYDYNYHYYYYYDFRGALHPGRVCHPSVDTCGPVASWEASCIEENLRS